jgi:plasmid stabilization system protein ParE
MNILDENIIASQRQRLRSWRIRVRQSGFYRRESCHRQYAIICLEVAPEEVAIFVRRVLRYPRLNTQAKRMGTVVRASHRGLGVWQLHAQESASLRRKIVTVTRPSGVRGCIVAPSQVKCVAQSWVRGLKKGANLPVSGSNEPTLGPLYRLHRRHAHARFYR